MNFEPEALLTAYREKFAASDLPQDAQASLMEELAAGLQGYTYLED